MRTLDALVAERFMEWKHVRRAGPPWDYYGQEPGRDDTNYNVPHYSDDISAAWRVVEKLWQTHKLSIAVWHVQPGQVGAFVKETIVGDFVGFTCDASELIVEPTAPRAICVAILRAVGVTQDEIDVATKQEEAA